jgi:hypothetical protein
MPGGDPNARRTDSPKLMFPESKLDRAHLDVAITDPFFIFEIEDLLPEDMFETLNREFPGPDLFAGSHGDRGGKSYLHSGKPAFFDFLRTSPAWEALYRSFTDPNVIARLYGLAHSVPSERPWRQAQPWRLVVDPESPAGRETSRKIAARVKGVLSSTTPIRLGLEFSRLESGCYIPPHTDVIKKLISLMIYFPDEGVDYDETAGTEFYRGKDGAETWDAWKSGMLRDADAKEFYAAHERFYVSRFSGNKLVGFIKSSNSWHGVRPLNLPPGAARRSININYLYV